MLIDHLVGRGKFCLKFRPLQFLKGKKVHWFATLLPPVLQQAGFGLQNHSHFPCCDCRHQINTTAWYQGELCSCWATTFWKKQKSKILISCIDVAWCLQGHSALCCYGILLVAEISIFNSYWEASWDSDCDLPLACLAQSLVLAIAVKKVLVSEFCNSLLAMVLCAKSSILYSGIPCTEQPWKKLP